MSHFAQLDENDIVTNIIIAEQEVIDSGIFGDAKFWIKTDFYTRANTHFGENNEPDGGTPFRGNYASIGQKYDRVNDVFYPTKIFPSWVMNESNWTWQAPVPKPTPTDTIRYTWNEETLSWDQIQR